MSHFKAKLDQILFPASVCPSVRPSLRWSVTLTKSGLVVGWWYVIATEMNGDLSSASSSSSPAAVTSEPGTRVRGGAVINPERRDLWPETETEHFPSLADRARASTRHVIKNGLASPTHSAHASFFRPHTNSSVNKVSADRRAKKV